MQVRVINTQNINTDIVDILQERATYLHLYDSELISPLELKMGADRQLKALKNATKHFTNQDKEKVANLIVEFHIVHKNKGKDTPELRTKVLNTSREILGLV